MDVVTPETARLLKAAYMRLYQVPVSSDLRRTRYEWVYFVQGDGGDSLIKIGRAYRVEKRLRALQSQSPTPLKLLAAIRAPRGTEYLFHECFAAYRIHGEWFMPVQPIVELARKLPAGRLVNEVAIRDIVKEFGVPAQAVMDFLLKGMRRKNWRRRTRYVKRPAKAA